MKLFNNHSGSRGLPRFIKGIYWATGLFLRTPFTEGCAGANKKASPPGRHQEQASKQRCTFSPTTFSSVQFSSWRPERSGPCSNRDSVTKELRKIWTVWCGIVEVCEGAPVAIGGWVLTDGHDLASCAAACRRFGQP